jgi:hypothetical protein
MQKSIHENQWCFCTLITNYPKKKKIPFTIATRFKNLAIKLTNTKTIKMRTAKDTNT